MSTPTAPTFFTVIADYKSVVVDIISDPDFDPQLGPISARVTFTPLLNDGEVIAATHTLPRPTGFIAAPIEGRIDTDGKLKLRVDPDGTRLDMPTRTSFPAVGTAGRVYHAIDNNTYWKWDGTRYAETFSYTPIRLLADTSVLELAGPLFYRVTFTDVVLNGRPGVINPFTFQAPTSDVEINLITVGAVPGQPASGITKIAPTGVRLNASGQIVFTFGGVDLPDPLTLSTVSSAGAPGPTGPAGPKGDKGDPGPKGDAGSGTAADLAATVVAATAITTPADADVLAVAESASSLKKLSWASLKTAILAWFGPVTATLSNKTLTSPTLESPTFTNYLLATGGYPVILSRAGTLALQVTGAHSAVQLGMQDAVGENWLSVSGGGAAATSVDVSASSNKIGKKVDLDLAASNGGVIKANGVPVVTTTNTVSMSNKTLVAPTITGNAVVNGAALGGRVAVPATATTAAKPGDWAADAAFIYAYTGDGTAHSWVRSAAAAW